MNTAARNHPAANDAPETKGRTVFALGPVELWIVAAFATAAIAAAGLWANSISETMKELGRSVAVIGERVARIEGKLEQQ